MANRNFEDQMSETSTTDPYLRSPEKSARRIKNPLDYPINAIAARSGSPQRQKEVARFLRFALVGISGAVIDISLVYVLQATILPPIPGTINVILATAIAFVTAVVSNFTWTRLWVYPDSRSKSIRRQLAMFTMISVIGGVTRTAWIAFSHSFIGVLMMPLALPFIQLFRPGYDPGPLATEKLGTLVALLIAMVIVMLWNFFANRYWTYNDIQ
jgi:putative flippase GtrA